MPRRAREKSESGIYHIMIRGVNREAIFEDDEDRKKFLESLGYYKEKSRYKLYGYCLMSNHVHILIKEEKETISLIMKRISSSYVYYYNNKYSRCGHLFQERYKSETVENDSYLLTVLRYIHRNPIEAKIAKEPEEYTWSSYNEYTNFRRIVDADFALAIFSEEDKGVAIQRFIKFTKEANKDKCLEYEESRRIDDKEAKKIIQEYTIIKNFKEIQGLEKEKRNEILKELKEKNILSIRQIARITGLSYNIVLNA